MIASPGALALGGRPCAAPIATSSWRLSPAIGAARSRSRPHVACRQGATQPRPQKRGPRRRLRSATADLDELLMDANACRSEAATAAGVPDAVLLARDGPSWGDEECAPVYLFGVDHGDPQPYIGRFILSSRPDAVVVETALTPSHGAAPFTSLAASASDDLAAGNSYVSFFNQLAYQVQRFQADDQGALWAQLGVRTGLCGEQLAYVAALAVDADIIYGDRPKDVTYRRLHGLTSLSDLDLAFGLSAWHNFLELLAGCAPDRSRVYGDCEFEKIMIHERDSVLCASIRRAAMRASVRRPGSCVVAVVGAAHVPGIMQRWRTGDWYGAEASVPGGEPLAVGGLPRGAEEWAMDWALEGSGGPEDLLWAPELGAGATLPGGAAARKPEALGVRRALLESVVRLQCAPSVLADLEAALGPVPDEQAEGYGAAYELYGTSRMLLASLERDELETVCNGWQCDMWDVLRPLRENRPLYGGPGYDPELTLDLRTLNFEFDPPSRPAEDGAEVAAEQSEEAA